MSIIRQNFGRIVQIRLRGTLTQKMALNVSRGLNQTAYMPVKAVIVNINSIGGSLTQAKNVCDMLANYRKEKNVKIYCFVEEQCLGVANLVLTMADQCYANRMSLLGGLGFSWSNLNFHRWQKKFNLKEQSLTANEMHPKYSFITEMTPETEEFTKNQLATLSAQLKRCVLENRKNQISQKAKQNENFMKEIDQQILSKPLTLPPTMLKYGLIDGIKNSWQIIQQSFPKSPIFLINKPNRLQTLHYATVSPEDIRVEDWLSYQK